MTGQTAAFDAGEMPYEDWAEVVPYAGQPAITVEPQPIEVFVVGVAPDDQLEIVKFADILDAPHDPRTYSEMLESVNHGEIDVLLVDEDDVAPMPQDWFEGRRVPFYDA